MSDKTSNGERARRALYLATREGERTAQYDERHPRGAVGPRPKARRARRTRRTVGPSEWALLILEDEQDAES